MNENDLIFAIFGLLTLEMAILGQNLCPCPSRGDHPTKILPKVSPIVVFTERIDLALVPGYLNRWFLSSFDSKFEVFWAVSGG